MADLGRQTIVAAGSVVVSPTQGEEVVAGNPARVVKKLINLYAVIKSSQ